MARKKTVESHIDVSTLDKGCQEFADKLGEAFGMIIKNEYGHARAPKCIMTPFNIKPLDALLGGGLVSSAPVMFSSTPETGKSTVCFQFAKRFQDIYPNSVVVYMDIEGSGNASESTDFQVSRVDAFGLDVSRFKYEPILLNVLEVFDLIKNLVTIKKKFEEKLQQEFYVCIIWDSIAATPSSKVDGAENPDKVIGVKARQLTFALEKYGALLAYNRITFLTVDQVRANIKIDGPYVPKESSVGTFKDFKAASSISALNHKLTQWIFLSKGKAITPADGYTGVDGWFINIMTEKNKHAPSKHSITVVFDKNTGINKFWSEYHFLSEMTPGETKVYKNKKFPYPLMMKKSGAWVHLVVKDPETGNIDYKSDKFYKKDALKKYNEDKDFKKWFDYAVDLSIHLRIKEGMFKINMQEIEEADLSEEATVEDIVVDGVLDGQEIEEKTNNIEDVVQEETQVNTVEEQEVESNNVEETPVNQETQEDNTELKPPENAEEGELYESIF